MLKNETIRRNITILLMIFLASCGRLDAVFQETNTNSAPTVSNVSNAYPNPRVVVSILEPAPVLGIVVDRDMKVLYIEPNSAASIAGIKVGDIIEEIGGIQVADKREVVKEEIAQSREKTITIKLKRDNEDLSVEAQPLPMAPLREQPTPTPVVLPEYYF